MTNDIELNAILDELNDSLIQSEQSGAVRTIALLLLAQQPAGCWEHSGNPSCTAIQTIQAMDALFALQNRSWLKNNVSPLRRAARWLCENNQNGKWGQDSFDTAEALRVLMQLSRQLSAQGITDAQVDSTIQTGVAYLRTQCADPSNRFKDYRGIGWYGPAFWASAAVVFYQLNEVELARSLLSEVMSFRVAVSKAGSPEDGCAFFESPEQVDNENLCIWNTAHTIIAITRLRDLVTNLSELTPFIRWLEYMQNTGGRLNEHLQGSWGSDAAQIGGDSLPICTYSSVVALHRAQGPGAQIQLGTQWFNRIVQNASDNITIGTTSLCAAAAMYSEVFDSKKLVPFLPLDMILKLGQVLEQKGKEAQNLQLELQKFRQEHIELIGRISAERDSAVKTQTKLQEDINSYVFKIRRDDLTLWTTIGCLIGIIGVAIGCLSIILSIATPFILAPAGR